MSETHWRQQAACVGYPPDLWFPHANAKATTAKEICAACPVKAMCAAFAATNPGLEGIWGGVLVDPGREPNGRRIRRTIPDPIGKKLSGRWAGRWVA